MNILERLNDIERRMQRIEDKIDTFKYSNKSTEDTDISELKEIIGL